MLILDIPGVANSPMGMEPTGASRSTSTSSRVCRQAATPEKPCGRVDGQINAKACIDGEGWGGVGVLGEEIGGFIGTIRESWCDFTFSLSVWVGGWISLAATMGHDGCSTFCHPSNFGALFSRGDSSTQGTLATVATAEALGFSPSSSFSGRATPWKTSSSVNDRYHFTSSLSSCTVFANRCGSPP